MINIKNLWKSYKNTNNSDTIIYQDMDLQIEKWSFISILGTSGSGKTTFLNLLSGLDTFDSWSIEVNGKKLESLNDDEKTAFRGKNISFIFQQFHLIDNLTVEENIDLIIELNKIKRRYDTKKLLEIVGLWNKLTSYPYNLSWGEQQRVAVARAFVWETPILLADEPTGNLDEENSKIVMDLITKLHKETGNTIIMITHDLKIAWLADTSFFLKDHKLISQSL